MFLPRHVRAPSPPELTGPAAAHAGGAADRFAPGLPWQLLVPVSLLALVAGLVGRAVSKPLWHDEIFSLYLGTRTTAGGLWNALEAGVDLNPPLYHLAVRASAALLGAGPLATRLPALLGFIISTVAVYVFVRRRLGPAPALFAALLPSLTGLYLYGYEGRPYGLVLGFSAVALVAWQVRGDRPRNRTAPVVCALMMAGAGFTHYYALMMVVPLGAGELVRGVMRRRLDWMMIAALAAGVVAPLVVLRPLIRGAREFAPTFWSRPALSELTGFYAQLTLPLGVVLLGAAIIVTMAAFWWGSNGAGAALPRSVAGPERASLPADEVVAALALFAVPAFGYVISVVATGVFHERYVLQGVLGFAVLGAWWCAVNVRSPRTQTILLSVVFLAFGARQAAGALGLMRGAPDAMSEHRALISMVPADSPLVVSHALMYLPLVHYSDAGDRRTYTYLTRPPDVVRRLGVDTGSRALHQLARIAPLDVHDYDPFVRTHRTFYVYGPRSWLIPTLLRAGAAVLLVVEGEDASLYSVTVQTS
jgi:hypothetical protein